MKSKIFKIIILCLIYLSNADAQINLVANGDFERIDTPNVFGLCPNGISQIDMCSRWFNRGMWWTDPTPPGMWGRMTSPDYYHTCATPASTVGVPLNNQGYKIDHTNAGFVGKAYAGIRAFRRAYFAAGGDGFYDDKYSEYVGTIITPMRLGDVYRLEYYTALSDSSKFACSMGMCLSADRLTSTTVFLKPPSTSIFWQFATSRITASMGWTQIKYDFLCTDASLTYLTIGNFIDTTYARMDIVGTESYPGIRSGCDAYYYIDDVALVCTDSMPRNNMPEYYSLCNNGYPTLDAGAGSLGSIQWYKEGIAIVGATNRYYTPSSVGTYSFIVTHPLIAGLTYTDVTTIYDSPLNTKISLVPYTNCDTFLFLHVLNTQSNLIYNWTATNVASGYPSSAVGDEFNTKFDHTAATHIVTLHVTDTKSDCVFDTSFTIYQCCYKINGPAILINQRINDLIWYNPLFAFPYYGTSGAGCQFCNTISIDGVLSIEKNYRFKNTAFYMQAFSRIDITLDDTLFLDSCYLTACSDVMWQGIFNGTQEWGNGTLIARDCIIEDAICGITILNGSFTHCIADTFNKNKTDILVKPFAGTYSPLNIYKSVFTCKDLGWRTFLSFPDPGDYLGLLIKPFWALKPHECIIADNVKNIQIGSGCLNCTNYFDNAYNGIHASNSNLIAINNHFSYIQPYRNYQGAGIFVEKIKGTSPLITFTSTIGGYAVNLNNTFENSRYGIISRNVASTIQNNGINFCSTGILVDSGQSPIGFTGFLSTVVKDNSIYNYKRGIDASFNNRTIIQILRNDLETSVPTFSNPASIGIFANQTLYITRFEIKDNIIKNGRTGISLLNIQSSRVVGNQVKMTSANTFAVIGINSNNSTRNLYANNRIVGSTTAGAISPSSTASSKAMYFGMSPNDTIHCNTTDTMTWGLEFMGSCLSPNNVFGNIMNKHHDQMTLRSAGVIGPQTSRNFGVLTNRLMANEYSPTLYTRSNTCAINSNGSAFLFQTKSITPFRPLVNIAIGPGTPLFPTPTLKPNYICNPYMSSGDNGTGMELDSSGIDEEKWMAAAIINGDIISDIENEAYQLWLKSELYTTLMSDSAIAVNDSLYQSFLSTNATSTIGAFYEIEQKILDEQYADAILLNDAIEPNNHFEENEKAIYQIILNMEATGYNQEVLSQLYTMAEECPISGGKAVYISRALLSSIDIEAYWEDDDRCIQGIDFRKANPTTNDSDKTNEIHIYPNPAKNILYISMAKEVENLSYIIRDIMGKIVMSKNISDKTLLNSVDISNLAEGMYIIEIMNTHNTKVQFKFNVIK